MESRFAQLWTFRDGLIARMEMYADRAKAVEALEPIGETVLVETELGR